MIKEILEKTYICEFLEECNKANPDFPPCWSLHEKLKFACSEYHYKRCKIE